jgi:hypothetical protein
VLREYRNGNELATEQLAEGMLVKVSDELAQALDDLERALAALSPPALAKPVARRTLDRLAGMDSQADAE